jgi:hypothetical protein
VFVYQLMMLNTAMYICIEDGNNNLQGNFGSPSFFYK